jgi:hypothetical protein
LNNTLREIATRIRGNKCEKLVRRIGNEITLSGASLINGGLKMNVGTFSNKVREIVKVPEVAVGLDDSQYLLCTTISDMSSDNQLKDKCVAIRLQLIMAFNQLRALLYSIQQEPNDDTKKELSKWLRFMNSLHKQSILLLNPGDRVAKGETDISPQEIMEYQGIEEKELFEAMHIVKT